MQDRGREPADGGTEPFGFAPVPWLPPFRLSPRLLFDGVLEAVLPPDALLPFARLRVRPDPLRVAPEAAEAAAFADLPAEELRARLAAVPAADRGAAARRARWALGGALAAAEATAALRALGDPGAWVAAAAARRGVFLRALDEGRPPPAASLLAHARAVPQAFQHLGKALPTAEALRLLAPLGRVAELGAGFGLFARALERAGLVVVASDPDPAAGTAFPVRALDAEASIALLRSFGAVPPLLLLWPQPEEGGWFAEVFARASPGQVIALASPEVEFCALGGLDAAPPPTERPEGWRAAAGLARRLALEFEPLGSAPLVAAGWPSGPTPLRLWRRR